MEPTIRIAVQPPRRANGRRRTLSAYIDVELVDQINAIVEKTNYNRADLVALLLEESLKRVVIVGGEE
ncbi:MAG: hypothetical protein Q4E13_03755 [Clostridia bacterium]|nr:hypothetical protein [Clostridia bacterium]